MKLFKKEDHYEHQAYADHVLIAFGKAVKGQKCEAPKLYGWYPRLEIPFFTKKVTYTDPYDFIVKTGFCRRIYLWRKSYGRKQIIRHGAWII